MNNAKASNAVVAIADAMASMAADYEQQIAELKQTNTAIVRQLQGDNERISKAMTVFHRLLTLPELEGFSWPLALLNDWPWPVPILNRASAGSSGTPPTSPTSEGDTPSG